MDLSTLSNGPFVRKTRRRVGRGPGSGLGKTSGKGHKGQKARAGYAKRAGFEGGQMPLHRRMPKRGFWHGDRFPMAVVNLDALEKAFEAGAEVTPESLVAAGLVRAGGIGVKVLGRGELAKKLTVRVNAISPCAREKVEKAGGRVELIETPKADAATEEGR
ncbi:MAG: 50S ribosomal protein L15 [Candidatus Hydrogenedentes bacterium]|nr:50S ribosomal protein L15 [Candidatus Hydrogenedentota bacterium]